MAPIAIAKSHSNISDRLIFPPEDVSGQGPACQRNNGWRLGESRDFSEDTEKDQIIAILIGRDRYR